MGRTRLLAAIGTVALGSGIALARQDVPPEHAGAAKLFAQACASCHTIPDPARETDKAWLAQVKETSWTDTPPEARVALQAYLQVPGLARPAAVEGPGAVEGGSGAPPFGAVQIDAGNGAGEVFVATPGAPRTLQRLAWKAGEQEPRRPLSFGRSHLLGYRLVRDAADGTRWMLSTTSTGYRVIDVGDKAPTPVKIPAEVRVQVRAQRHRGRLHVSVAVQGDEGIGCSIYRAGARIPLGWRALDAAGKVLAEGPLRYGWGGGASAAVAAPDGTVRLDVPFPGMPFPVVGERAVALPAPR